MPADFEYVGQYMKAATHDKRIGNGIPNAYVPAVNDDAVVEISTFQDRIGTRLHVFLHDEENFLPFPHQPILVLLQILVEKQFLTYPARTLLEGTPVITDGAFYPLIANSHQSELFDKQPLVGLQVAYVFV